MTMKTKFKIGDSVVIGSRKSDWYGKIGKVVALYENERFGVSYRGEPARVYKATSLGDADKRYEALVSTNPNWKAALKEEMAQLNEHNMFVNPRNDVKPKNKDCRCSGVVEVGTVDDNSSGETENYIEKFTDKTRAGHGKKSNRTSERGGWTWTLTREMNNNNNDDAMHTTNTTDDDDSVNREPNADDESLISQESRHVPDHQTKLLVDRIQELAEENAILRLQNSRKNRIIKLLLEDFKVMDISDAYFSEDRLK
jgi:hypothetical protein